MGRITTKHKCMDIGGQDIKSIGIIHFSLFIILSYISYTLTSLMNGDHKVFKNYESISKDKNIYNTYEFTNK